MIGYVTLGSNDIARAAEYYDALLGELGAKRFMESENFVAWATDMGKPSISVIKPHDGNEATVGNGMMVAIVVDSNDKVDSLYAKAIELGGTATGEHGVGIGKTRYMQREHGAALDVMRNIKQTLDPNAILNPGKIFP